MRKLERLLLTCLLFSSLNLAAQNRAVTGRVINQGQPVAGVTVTIKGTKTSTETDSSGNFSIQASNTDVLQFSSVGFTRREVRVGESAFINVELDIAPKELEEVVTTGYNIKRDKKSLGYAAPVV